MEKSKLTLPEIKLVGITVRTNNANEMKSDTAKIGMTIQKYFGSDLASKIPHRQNSGVTFCVYTQYESDHTGDYTYFVGEEVESFDNLPVGLETLTISTQQYTKFTTPPGQMPAICVNAWQEIWQMNSDALLGDRTYQADFEVYDQRAADPSNAVLDIYIGVE
jgi:predicted transcriptional regulator YdeE